MPNNRLQNKSYLSSAEADAGVEAQPEIKTGWLARTLIFERLA